MAERSHYLDILLREPTIGHQLHARLLSAAHARIANGDDIAVSWPDWRQTPGEFGLMFRVFGEPSSLANYAQAAELFARIGDRYHAGLVAENTAALFEKNDPGAAVGYYGKALAAYRDLDLPNDQAYVLLGLGNLHRSAGDLVKAGGALSEGVALAKRSGDMQLVMDYEYALAELADRMADSKATGEHFKRFIALSDSLRNAGSENELMRLRAEFETEQAEKDNELLRLKDRENSERLRRRNIQLYGSLILAVLALGAVALAWRNIRLRKRHEVELEALNAELHGKQARIEEINGLLRLKVLRTQMDPHFIHNCLNAIRALSLKGEHERAEEYLEGFARLLRSVLEHSVRDRISLDEEIAFLNDYVKLEQLRLGADFTWSITADEALLAEEPQVPSLLVQPFVENAIWHGLAPKQGPKRLTVRFSISEDGVQCIIEDNGVGRASVGTAGPVGGHRSLGLQLTGERLQLLTEHMTNKGHFRIEDLKDNVGISLGTRVVLNLNDATA